MKRVPWIADCDLRDAMNFSLRPFQITCSKYEYVNRERSNAILNTYLYDINDSKIQADIYVFHLISYSLFDINCKIRNSATRSPHVE